MRNKFLNQFVRIGVAKPAIKVGNPLHNAQGIIHCLQMAVSKNVDILLFPELCVTAYSCGDLFHQQELQQRALEAVTRITNQTIHFPAITILIGTPLAIGNSLFNVVLVIQGGKILGIVPKRSLPNYREFYEMRYFVSGRLIKEKSVLIPELAQLSQNSNGEIPIGLDLLFAARDNKNAVLGIEICEDGWTPIPPGAALSVAGATMIFNPSGSNELVGKADFRRSLVERHSAQNVGVYVYASSGVDESTMDVVFGGHCMVAENGHMLVDTPRFQRNSFVECADVDLGKCIGDRQKMSSYGECTQELTTTYRRIHFNLMPFQKKEVTRLLRPVNSHPFVPSNETDRTNVVDEIFNIQMSGLVTRMIRTGKNKLFLGLSGGGDSTLALLVCLEACKFLGLPATNVETVTLPGLATSRKTRKNVDLLKKATGVSFREVSIVPGSNQRLKDIGHSGDPHINTSYENVQARMRTGILFDIANNEDGLVIGTGTLSEAALGWCTFIGDHASHYHVNIGVPKTLVVYMMRTKAKEYIKSKNKQLKALGKALIEITDKTVMSPELLGTVGGKIEQKTEDKIGFYEVHDFILSEFVRWGSSPEKIFFLAKQAFKGVYTPEKLKWHFRIFYSRFFDNQFKRSFFPDGIKVGSVSLSPRGDWRMPTDADRHMWLAAVDLLEI